MTLPELLERFPGARRQGRQWVARCPGHDDGRPSLALAEAADRSLLHCRAGCSPERVLRAIGLQFSDLFMTARALARQPLHRPAGTPRLTPEEAEVVAEHRRHMARLAPYREAFALADEARESAHDAAVLRRQASWIGDTEDAWTLLVLALEADRDVQLAELELAAASHRSHRA